MHQTDALAGTKNTTGDKSYRTQLPPHVMKSIAGFSALEFYTKQKDTFRVYTDAPLSLPFDSPCLLNVIFPCLERWREEQASENGDKGASAKMIMDKILPFLAKVILQDGVYWFINHPTNDASVQLRQMVFDNGQGQRISFPEYARRTLQKIMEARRRDQGGAQNGDVFRSNTLGTPHDYTRMNHKLDRVLQTMHALKSSMDHLMVSCDFFPNFDNFNLFDPA